jgi:hypothetical protein
MLDKVGPLSEAATARTRVLRIQLTRPSPRSTEIPARPFAPALNGNRPQRSLPAGAVRSGSISARCFAAGLGCSSCYLLFPKSANLRLGRRLRSFSSQLKAPYQPFETFLASRPDDRARGALRSFPRRPLEARFPIDATFHDAIRDVRFTSIPATLRANSGHCSVRSS